MGRHKVNAVAFAFVIILLFLGIYFLGFGGQKGIAVDCKLNTVTGIDDVPPPLLSVANPTYCTVDAVVVFQNKTSVCSYTINLPFEKGVIPCLGLKELKGTQNELDFHVNFQGANINGQITVEGKINTTDLSVSSITRV